MVGSRIKAVAHKVQEPSDTDPHRTADATQRDSLAQESFDQGALLIRDHVIVWEEDKDTPTDLTFVVLFARVNVAVPLILPRSTSWICLSLNHSALSGLHLLVSAAGQA
jgi:hypothetical protein